MLGGPVHAYERFGLRRQRLGDDGRGAPRNLLNDRGRQREGELGGSQRERRVVIASSVHPPNERPSRTMALVMFHIAAYLSRARPAIGPRSPSRHRLPCFA